jgi:small subunit ribosomal protein S20
MQSATGLAHSGHILPNSDEYTSDVSVALRLFTLLLLGLHNNTKLYRKIPATVKNLFSLIWLLQAFMSHHCQQSHGTMNFTGGKLQNHCTVKYFSLDTSPLQMVEIYLSTTNYLFKPLHIFGRCSLAHHKSAIKRIKQNDRKNARNKHVRSTLRTHIKRVREAVAANDLALAKETLQAAIPYIDSAASKGVIHRSNASRNVSRLSKLVGTLG